MAKNPFERCVEKGLLVRIKPNPKSISEELRTAEYDLERGEKSLAELDVNERLAAPPLESGGMPALRAGLLAARLHPRFPPLESGGMPEDFKWSAVQAYYSMFHAARALLIKAGYREKSHWCLMIAVRELYCKTGELEEEFIRDLKRCMDIRHSADYSSIYEEASSRGCLRCAKIMLGRVRLLLATRDGLE